VNKYYKPKCPRCGSGDTRAQKKKGIIQCRRCGYTAHWKQFYEGEVERKEVMKMFKKGNLEGKQRYE